MTRRANLFGTSTFATLAIALAMHAPGAFAQSTAAPPAPSTTTTPSVGGATPAAAAIEDIVITGTRIRVQDYQLSNPVVSVTADTIHASGETNIGDFLKSVPALVASSDSADNSGDEAGIGTTGLNLLNLRNLGIDRTLVLVNGRRHVGGLEGSAAVDVNTIPTDLIENVEILTGGASAIYGADGVSGVVNFVTKRHFSGVDSTLQYGQPDGKGGENTFFSTTMGENFNNNRGNVALSFEYNRSNAVKSLDRKSASQSIVVNPAELIDDPADLPVGEVDDPLVDQFDDPDIPDHVFLSDIRYFDSNPGGAIDIEGDDIMDFRFDGQPWNGGTFVPDFFQQGGDGTPTYGYGEDLLGQTTRYSTNLLFSYDVNSMMRAYSELKYVHTNSQSTDQPTFDFFIPQSTDNPFIPAGLQTALAGVGATDFFLDRDNFDLGRRAEDIDRNTYRAVVGFDGDINEHLSYDVSYTFGQTNIHETQKNNRLEDRFAAAVDVVTDPSTGNPICRSDLDPTTQPDAVSFTPGLGSGCQPLNLYGNGSPSAAARDWVMFNSQSESKLIEYVANAYISGDFADFLKLPGGSIEYALGGEYRHEESRNTPDPRDTAGITFGNAIDPSGGTFDVRETFGELRLPILKDEPFAKTLTADAAYRYSSYSTTGAARTWKYGLQWAPIEDITFRGTKAKAVRAPNIGELFGASAQTFEFIRDPCDPSHVNEGTATRAANCAALLTGLGVDPTTFNDTNSSNISGLVTGNPDLSQETADTKTFGVILRPRFLSNLTASVDWYSIDINQAINQATGEELAQLCVDQPTLANQFCGFINRDPATGVIADFVSQPLNVAAFNTEGLDFNIRYRLDPADLGFQKDWGRFEFGLTANKLKKLEFINTPGAPVDSDLGEVDAPEWQATLDVSWKKGPWTVNYGYNWFGQTSRVASEEFANDPDYGSDVTKYYDDLSSHDIQARYKINDNAEVYAGINNFTNQEASIGAESQPISPLGRFFYVGLKTHLVPVSEWGK